MTGNELIVLATLYVDYDLPGQVVENGELRSVTVWAQNALIGLRKTNLIGPDGELTEAGDVFIKHVLGLPMPRATWTMEQP